MDKFAEELAVGENDEIKAACVDIAEKLPATENDEFKSSCDEFVGETDVDDKDECQASCEVDDDLVRLEKMMLESDEYFDVHCYPCSKEGRNVGALKYCLDCDRHMCQKCLAQHNRFDMMKNHAIVENDKKRVNKTAVGLPTQRCDKHHGKLLEMYCRHHDDVCCVVCVAVDHGHCSPMEYIPNFIEQNINHTDSESQEVLRKIRILEKTFTDGIEKKERAETVLQAEKSDIINKLDVIRHAVDKRLDIVQKGLLRNLDKKYGKNKSIIDVGRNVLTDAVGLLQKEEDDLNMVMSNGNNCTKFVQTKLAERSISQCRSLQESVAAETNGHIFFRPDSTLSSFIDGIKHIGSVETTMSSLSLDGLESINVRSQTDRTVPTISGICMQNNGLILMTDWENSNVKCLNQKYAITDEICLPGKPYDICCVDDDMVAVSETNKRLIQYIVTRDKMSLSSSFKTGDACRGLAFYKELLYVACGGKRLKKEGKGHIEVYNKSGEPLKILSENLSYPGHIAVARAKVYVADSLNNLVVLDLDGKCLHNCSYKNMLDPMSVTDGPEGQLFLGGWTSHNIYILTESTRYIRSLLEKEDGIYNLHTMYFDWMRSKLYCTMRDSNTALVYSLLTIEIK